MEVHLDLLPPRAGLEVEIAPELGKVRFIVYRTARWTKREKKRSLPSAWFSVPDEPIQLSWDAFEWP